MKKSCAFAPATIANLNVGYDVLGLALRGLGDKVEVAANHSEKNTIAEIQNGAKLPYGIEENCCSVVIRKMQENLRQFEGVDIRIHKGFASGSGLGSSSASSAAAAIAYNDFLGSPFAKEELVKFAAEGERVACGAAHWDNVAPAIMGGMVLIHQGKLISLPSPTDLFAVSFFPMVKINTADARGIVRQNFPIKLVSQQVAHMGAFVASLYQKDLELFSKSLQDLLIEPTRNLLIPKFQEMKMKALENQALAFGISGSGPSVFALAKNQDDAQNILQVLESIYTNSGINTKGFIESLAGNKGAYITEF